MRFFEKYILFTATDDPNDQLGISATTAIYTNTDLPTEQTGYCMTWGQHHYRSFDGKIFRFQGDCSYTLVEDNEHFISVVSHNTNICSVGRCLRYFIDRIIFELK